MSSPADSPKTETDLKIAAEDRNGIDVFLDRSSEWFSSILVKESRQALKSRQFLWTFFGLLIVVTCWALGALAYVQSEYGDDQSPGQYLLFGFWLILGFPLAIVIPFATFRSLAREFEDGTLQLVSITTLKPYQIIWGKLGSSILQIMVYLSVLAPCIAFTYLLRGIDIRQIWWGLGLAVTSSISLCVTALFLASGARSSRQFGVLISVFFLFALAFVYWLWCLFAYGLTYQFVGIFSGLDDQQASTIMFGYLSLLVSSSFLLFTAAAAQVSFEADNRSSWIRVAMLVQQILFFGWIAAMLSYFFDSEIAGPVSMTIVHYWLFMGAMMSAVPAIMSRRVKRALPKTVVSRSVMSLFMPGPGRGYLFAISNMLGWNLLLLLMMLLAPYVLPDVDAAIRGSSDRTLSGNEIEEILLIMISNCIYGITFLSILFLLLKASVKKRPHAGPLYGAVVTIVFLMVVTFVPVLAKMQWMPNTSREYSLILATNWYVTFGELMRYGTGNEAPIIATAFMGLAMLFFGYFSLRIASRELHYLPEAIPNRVLEEERKKRKVVEIPIGESIDEILGLPRQESGE